MDAQSTALLEIFGEAAATSPENSSLKEAFDRAMAMLGREDQGWMAIFGAGDGEKDQYGLTLDDLKKWSNTLDESVIGAPWIGAGYRRRRDYVWQNGIHHSGIPDPIRGKKNIRRIIDRPGNQANFFSPTAHYAREHALYTSGVAFWIMDENHDITSIPLRQITDEMLEPNGLGYAIAYKREWSERNLETSEVTPHVRWYFVAEHESLRVQKIRSTPKSGGEAVQEEVDQNSVIFDMHVNRAPGRVYGAPDALAAWVWNNIAKEATLDGKAMLKALAKFALKASVKSKEGGQNASAQLATTEGAGNVAVTGQANDLVPLSSAGKGYDFKTLTFLVAIVATSLDISLIDITGDPANAGSSYGAGQLMALPTRLAMTARREEHIAFDTRVLRYMGVDNPDVNFTPFSTGDETYRAIQSLVLLLNSAGTHTRQEVRNIVDDLLGQPNGIVPGEDRLPAVLLAKALAKVQPPKAAADRSTQGSDDSLPQAASPNQGRGNGSGGQSGASNDIRRKN